MLLSATVYLGSSKFVSLANNLDDRCFCSSSLPLQFEVLLPERRRRKRRRGAVRRRHDDDAEDLLGRQGGAMMLRYPGLALVLDHQVQVALAQADDIILIFLHIRLLLLPLQLVL